MDAYEFFTKKHEKDIDYSNIYKLGSIYNLLGKYFPSAIKYLNKMMEKYPNDKCMQDYMKKLKYMLQVEYKYQVYTRQIRKPIFTRSENRMFYYINHEMGDLALLPRYMCLLYGRYKGNLDDEYDLLFKEVTIKKKKYVNDRIKSIFELIYQRASTTKNDGVVKMVNDSIWILKRISADNNQDKQWKEDMIKKLETVYDTDKWNLGVVRR